MTPNELLGWLAEMDEITEYWKCPLNITLLPIISLTHSHTMCSHLKGKVFVNNPSIYVRFVVLVFYKAAETSPAVEGIRTHSCWWRTDTYAPFILQNASDQKTEMEKIKHRIAEESVKIEERKRKIDNELKDVQVARWNPYKPIYLVRRDKPWPFISEMRYRWGTLARLFLES